MSNEELVARIRAGEDESLTLEDTIRDERDEIENTLERVQREELSRLLWSLVDNLEKRESDVLRKRYKEGLSRKNCGEELGISAERVRLIENRAMQKMRSVSVRKQLESYREERALSVAYSSTGLGTFRRTWTSAPERAVLILENC